MGNIEDQKPDKISLVNKVLLGGAVGLMVARTLFPTWQIPILGDFVFSNDQTYSIPEEQGLYFHEKGEFEDGTPYGTLGAMIYALNKDGEPISLGFQEINSLENGGYESFIGSCRFTLDDNFQIKDADGRDTCLDLPREYGSGRK